ncbi:restriction endonuclease subunit S [uncultured Cetobacterium sp.]|uniref:restriction endonuclease subunit S n=1 Tax=uncultured Cetobacterium sp. TaxID=527638 RepID=UPI0025E19688|nr:restriction endonuclease subunit S [uncultured Cetobacterium sp.]
MKNKVPKLRFPEFSGEWEEKKFHSIFKIFNGYAFSSSDSRSNGIRWVKIADVGIKKMKEDSLSFLPFDYKKKYSNFLLNENDYVLALTRPILNNQLKIAKVNSNFHNSLLNQRVGKLESNQNIDFVYQLLQRNNIVSKIEVNIAGSDPPNLSPKEINNLKTNIPSLPEQEKIASFLSEVDTKIEKLEKKKELLSQYKKGMMQKLFSQKLRFKDENGNDYPEWEEKNGSDIFENISNKNHSSDLPILAITQDKGAIPREMIDMKVIVSESSIESYKVVNKGDFIISLRSFQGGIEYSAYDGICSPAYIILKPKNEIIDNFFKNYLKTERYIQKLCSKLEGIRDGKMISYKYFSEIKLPFPFLTEQEKIANFLSSIDRKIELVEEELEKNKKFKKGLLQQMFV